MALVGVAVVATSPHFRARGHRLVFQVESLHRLEEGAPVLVEGYRVGRVRAIDPVAVPGGLEFRVAIGVRRQLSSGLPLELQQGTWAEVVSEALFSAPVVVLYPSPDPNAAPLPEGGAIPARLEPVAAEAMGRRMPGLIDQLDRVFARLPDMLDQVEHALEAARMASDTASALLADVRATTARLSRDAQVALAHAEGTMGSLERISARTGEGVDTVLRRIVATMDSVAVVVGEATRLVEELRAMRAGLEPNLDQILADLEDTTLLLNYVMHAIAERPLRLFTGVRLPEPASDTVASTRDTSPGSSPRPPGPR